MAIATRLSPPQIESKLPAFDKVGNIAIPFNLNRAVGRDQVSGMALVIKTVQTNVQKAILTAEAGAIRATYGSRGYVVEFNLGDFEPLVGQYYKVQLACIDNENIIGYYSSVGVIKCTTQPKIIFNNENLQRNTYEYTVVCSQAEGDITEKVYSYCFNLYDEGGNLIETSGEQLHNSSKDLNSYETVDTWILRKKLEPNIEYQIGYSAVTINGCKVDEKRVPILDATTSPPNVHADLVAIPNNDNGYITIGLLGNGDKVKVSGSFILIRASSEDGFESWCPMTKFQLVQWIPSETKMICRDYSVQQGIEYQYALQAYNTAGLYSNRMYSSRAICDFEDAFLYDGERQLKIRFNPKVSSFKSTIMESKTNTIGGKYPFIFRNGNINYKEFQISGLITLLGDEDNEFQSNLPRGKYDQRMRTPADTGVYDTGTWLTGENFQRERQFKLEVLEWLNDGKPKLFRSPSEGNYIVRLMSVSLTPNDTLGRMLHTFNCSACEIAEPTFENFYDYGFVVENYTEMRNMKIEQVNVNMYSKSGLYIPGAYIATISGDPGVEFLYTLANYTEKKSAQIGDTGIYIFSEEVLKETPLTSLEIKTNKKGHPVYLTYGYYDEAIDTFSYIYDIKITDEVIQQSGLGMETNLITELEDARTKTGAFHFIRVRTKTLQTISWNNTIKTYQYDETSPVTSWNYTSLYQVTGEGGPIYFNGANAPSLNTPPFINGSVNPAIEDKALYDSDKLYDFKIDDNPMVDFSGNHLTDGRYDSLSNISNVEKLYAGQGIILDLVYQKKEITYSIELENQSLIKLKARWEDLKKEYEKNPTQENEAKMNTAYNTYVEVLEGVLDSEGVNDYDIEYAI